VITANKTASVTLGLLAIDAVARDNEAVALVKREQEKLQEIKNIITIFCFEIGWIVSE
jgi:short-subunit dehydrogenase